MCSPHGTGTFTCKHIDLIFFLNFNKKKLILHIYLLIYYLWYFKYSKWKICSQRAESNCLYYVPGTNTGTGTVRVTRGVVEKPTAKINGWTARLKKRRDNLTKVILSLLFHSSFLFLVSSCNSFYWLWWSIPFLG